MGSATTRVSAMNDSNMSFSNWTGNDGKTASCMVAV
jgi:hypothetical protein